MDLKNIKTKNQLLNDLTRKKDTQSVLDKTENKCMCDLKNLKLKRNIYFKDNYSFSDFKSADIQNVVFKNVNFSFARNFDKAIKNNNTDFFNCNFTGVVETELPYPEDRLKKQGCNVSRLFEDFTDKDIEDFTKNIV